MVVTERAEKKGGENVWKGKWVDRRGRQIMKENKEYCREKKEYNQTDIKKTDNRNEDNK